MSTQPNWLRRAIRGLRDFAYAEKQDSAPRRLGLALGGGFARGIAHIGVLRVLEQNKIPVEFISGTSVGALIAATYAAGASLEDMEKHAALTTFRDFGRWTLSRMGMASNERLEAYLRKFTSCRHFHDTKIPICIVATDVVKGESVYLQEGELGPALRASCAYPGLFLPVEYQGHTLVDGFLTEGVPSRAVRAMGANVVIGVHLEPGLLDSKPRNTIEVISRSFSILQISAVQGWRAATDVLIEPNVHHILWDEFAKTPQLVEAGEEATRKALPEIRAALQGRIDKRVTPDRRKAMARRAAALVRGQTPND